QLASDWSVDLSIAVRPPICRGDALLAVDLVVYLDAPIVVRARLALAIHIVVEVSRDIRSRNKRQRPLGYAAEMAGRDLIIGEWVACIPARAIRPCRCRIVQREGIVGEITGPFLRSRQRLQIPRGNTAAQPEP